MQRSKCSRVLVNSAVEKGRGMHAVSSSILRECDSKLIRYINTCNPQSETTTRQGKFLDHSCNQQHFNWMCSSYILIVLWITVISPAQRLIIYQNGSDIQCAIVTILEHSVALACLAMYGLSLGSSLCVSCPIQLYWFALLVVILLAAFIA